MADQTLKSWCAGCGTFHKADDCTWKPAVSGIDLTVPRSDTGTVFGVFKTGPLIYTPDTVTTPVNPWDNQVGGQHYKKGIQPFEYAMANNLNSLEFSVVKYLRKKGDKAKRLEDLNKAKDCLEKLIWWEEHDGKI